jgi:large subunit ribosomal protein L9
MRVYGPFLVGVSLTDFSFILVAIHNNSHVYKTDEGVMQVYMLKDVERVGMVGQTITVSDGYAANFLIPRHLAVEITSANAEFYKTKKHREQVVAEVVNSKVAMLAERIKSIHLLIKERVHDDGKLYGAVGAEEIVDLLREKDIEVNKKQVEFNKSVKTIGEHKVTIKLSSKLRPQLTLKVESSAHK